MAAPAALPRLAARLVASRPCVFAAAAPSYQPSSLISASATTRNGACSFTASSTTDSGLYRGRRVASRAVHTTRAVVAHEPPANPPSPNLSWQELTVRDPGPSELLIKFVATGICHTDVVCAVEPGMGDRVLGHEGSGYVVAVGSGVTKAKVGDPVLMSFISCQDCRHCHDSHPAHCPEFVPLNFTPRPAFTNQKSEAVGGMFFGQSSFANYSVVSETGLLNAKDLIQSEDELKLFAPLGCGIQTGAACVTNIMQAGPKTSLMVAGLGGVGLAAIMAGKVAGCQHIVAVDRVQSRLDLAMELGATSAIDTSKIGLETLPAEVKKHTGNFGATHVLDTTGVNKVQEAAYASMSTGGQLILVGVSSNDGPFTMTSNQIMGEAKSIRGSLMGDSVSADFVPKMIDWYRAGKFPIDKLIKYVEAEKWEAALESMHTGETVKPVLIW